MVFQCFPMNQKHESGWFFDTTLQFEPGKSIHRGNDGFCLLEVNLKIILFAGNYVQYCDFEDHCVGTLLIANQQTYHMFILVLLESLH